MAELFASRWIGDFLFAFGALFAIINPYGLAFIFLDRTMGLSDSERARVALRVALYAFAVMLGSLFVGAQVLKIFGISMPALRIAGRLVVAAAGWSMLQAPPTTPGAHATSSAAVRTLRRAARSQPQREPALRPRTPRRGSTCRRRFRDRATPTTRA